MFKKKSYNPIVTLLIYNEETAYRMTYLLPFVISKETTLFLDLTAALVAFRLRVRICVGQRMSLRATKHDRVVLQNNANPSIKNVFGTFWNTSSEYGKSILQTLQLA